MDTDYRALCAELLDALDGWHQAVFETGTGWVRPDETYLLDRARAALAEPDGPAVPEGREPASVVREPSDEELRAVWCDGWNTSEEWGALNFARAVLARFGHHSPDATKMVGPAEEEVAELVAELRRICFDVAPCEADAITRAADLLGQRHPAPVPVPVSERLPGDRKSVV